MSRSSKATFVDLSDLLYHLDDFREVMEKASSRIDELTLENQRLTETLEDYEKEIMELNDKIDSLNNFEDLSG